MRLLVDINPARRGRPVRVRVRWAEDESQDAAEALVPDAARLALPLLRLVREAGRETPPAPSAA